MHNMIERALELYTWRAVYDDDITAIYETEENNFACVDQSRVKTLLLLSLQGDGVAHRVDIPHGAQAVFFRRRRIAINPIEGSAVNHSSTHCIGWKQDDKAVYLFVFEDGSSWLSENLQAV